MHLFVTLAYQSSEKVLGKSRAHQHQPQKKVPSHFNFGLGWTVISVLVIEKVFHLFWTELFFCADMPCASTHIPSRPLPPSSPAAVSQDFAIKEF